MALLKSMPAVLISPEVLKHFGDMWLQGGHELEKKQGMDLSDALAGAIAPQLAEFLGGIPIIAGKLRQLQPRPEHLGQDVVELKDLLVVGGVRPQHFDVGYRPDGTRIVIDVKTLNKTESVGKNYPNMINDLTAEATTVHTRFPYAIVAFLVAVPAPCLEPNQARGLIRRLEGLGRRDATDGGPQLAEAIAFVVWDPETGAILTDLPPPDSPIRIEKFSARIERIYVERYDGAAPHLPKGTRVKTAAAATPDAEVPEEDSVDLGDDNED